MTKANEPSPFGPEHAATYDAQWAKLAPMMTGLHFLSGLILNDLPKDAHILCVGAGTGSEVLALAKVYPGWRFTAVEPSGAMLNVCRAKAEKAGIASQCEFHEGYLDSLPKKEKFHGATSILVSQFLPTEEQRKAYFRQILERLHPGGYFINADLSVEASAHEGLLEIWVRAMMFTGIPAEQAKLSTSRWGKEVSVLKQTEIASLLAASGFESPTLFHQALFIHAWFARAPKN